jgi:hypothetical protein
MKINIWRILHTWRWPRRPKHLVKDSENQTTIKLHADGNITNTWRWSCRPKHVVKNSENRNTIKLHADGNITYTWRWPCRPKHLVKDSGNQNTMKLHANGNITCNNPWSLYRTWFVFSKTAHFTEICCTPYLTAPLAMNTIRLKHLWPGNYFLRRMLLDVWHRANRL